MHFSFSKIIRVNQKQNIMNSNQEQLANGSLMSKVISIASVPPKMESLKEMVNSPAEIDAATMQLGIPPFLLNLELAVSIDLSYLNMGLEKATYVPRAVSDRDGGRKSQYLLCPGETIMAGVYFLGGGMLLRYVTRLTGETPNASTGDCFMEQYKTRDGKVIYEGKGILKVTDEKKGIGKYELIQTTSPQFSIAAKPYVTVWVIWSAILVEVEK